MRGFFGRLNRVVWVAMILGPAALAGLAEAQAPDLTRMDIVLKAIPDGPVARVEKETISAEEFRDLYLADLAFTMQMVRNADIPELTRIEIAMNSLRKLIERSILYQEAEKRGLSVTEDEVQKAWEREFKRMSTHMSEDENKPMTEAEFLEVAQTTKEDALAELKRALLIEKMQEQIVKDEGLHVTDQEIREFYEENKERARQPAMVHTRQVFIQSPLEQDGAPGVLGRDEARKRAEEALKRIHAGESIGAVSKSVSDGQLRDKEGDLGPLPLSALPEFMQEQIRQMKPGELSGVLESPHGFHIVELVETIPGKDPSFEELKPQIERLLKNRKTTEAVRAFCSKISDDSDLMSIYLDLDKQIALRPDLQKLLAEEANTQPQIGEEPLGESMNANEQ